MAIQWSCESKSAGAHPSHLIARVSTQTRRWTDLWAHASCEVMTLAQQYLLWYLHHFLRYGVDVHDQHHHHAEGQEQTLLRSEEYWGLPYLGRLNVNDKCVKYNLLWFEQLRFLWNKKSHVWKCWEVVPKFLVFCSNPWNSPLLSLVPLWKIWAPEW